MAGTGRGRTTLSRIACFVLLAVGGPLLPDAGHLSSLLRPPPTVYAVPTAQDLLAHLRYLDVGPQNPPKVGVNATSSDELIEQNLQTVLGLVRQNRSSHSQVGSFGPPLVGQSGDASHWQQVGDRMAVRRYGYSPAQVGELNYLVGHESGWDPGATNPTSSARGIPQAMMSAHFGDNWQSDPAAQWFLHDPMVQLRWLFDYIQGRYGGIDAAYEHKRSHGNY